MPGEKPGPDDICGHVGLLVPYQLREKPIPVNKLSARQEIHIVNTTISVICLGCFQVLPIPPSKWLMENGKFQQPGGPEGAKPNVFGKPFVVEDN